jgi:hypothetical protein
MRGSWLLAQPCYSSAARDRCWQKCQTSMPTRAPCLPPPSFSGLQAAKNRGIPVIYDEVFTGCWRLGPATAGQMLAEVPDIACYAKLLTGGVAPLAVTLSTEAVFDAFKGDSKVGKGMKWLGRGCAARVARGGGEGASASDAKLAHRLSA